MTDVFQTNHIKGILSQADCPAGLQEAYLNYLRTEEQQSHIVRNKITMMFHKEMSLCRRHRQPMEGSATFSRAEDAPSASPETGLFIGIEFILCCFSNGIPARIADYKQSNGEVTEVTVCFGMANLKLFLGKKQAINCKS